MTLAGPGSVQITTGVVLSGNSGYDTSGTTINSTPGNVVNANLDSGSAQFMIHSPSAITFNGILSGSGGLTKTGGRTAFFNNDNTYTGETHLNGFVRFNRNVPSGAPSPFGNSTTPIILYNGNIAPINPATQAANGSMTGILAADVNAGALTFTRPLTVRGAGAALLRNFSNGALTFSGPIVVEEGAEVTFDMFGVGGTGSDQLISTGVISGPGRVRTRQTASGGATPGSFVRITGNNTFTGGFDPGGSVEIGHDNAMGVSSVTLGRSATFSAFGGARNITNPLYVVTGTLGFGGADPFTWAGEIHGVGGEFPLNVTNTALTTLSGTIVEGGFFKQGPGSLVISGNNSHSGISNFGNGPTAGGVVFIDSDTALGNTVGNSGVNADTATGGGNTMVLRGGRNIGNELMFLRGIGTGGMGGMHATTGNNSWGGRVFASAQYTNVGSPSLAVLSTRMTVGADNGAALAFGRSIVSLDSGASDGTTTQFLAPNITLTKLGGGLVSVGSDPFVVPLGGGTSGFRGSVLLSGGLDIAGGTMKMTNVVADSHIASVADVASISIAGGPGAATARLDLGKNALVIDYTGSSPANDVRAYVIQGYAGGAWTGNGIASSDADSTNFGVGYVDNTGSGVGTNFITFNGDPVDNTAMLVAWTAYGDANLDGLVNLADFNRLAGGFGTPAGAVWGQGDFNYDGAVGLTDFNRLAANFGVTAGPGGPTPADWATLMARIPEPASAVYVGLSALLLATRRRRRRNLE
jgi:autotransporter-associated beta strand protein